MSAFDRRASAYTRLPSYQSGKVRETREAPEQRWKGGGRLPFHGELQIMNSLIWNVSVSLDGFAGGSAQPHASAFEKKLTASRRHLITKGL